MVRLGEHAEVFHGLADSFASAQEPWKAIYDSSDPGSCKWPEPWDSKLDTFQKLLLLRWVGWVFPGPF